MDNALLPMPEPADTPATTNLHPLMCFLFKKKSLTSPIWSTHVRWSTSYSFNTDAHFGLAFKSFVTRLSEYREWISRRLWHGLRLCHRTCIEGVKSLLLPFFCPPSAAIFVVARIFAISPATSVGPSYSRGEGWSSSPNLVSCISNFCRWSTAVLMITKEKERAMIIMTNRVLELLDRLRSHGLQTEYLCMIPLIWPLSIISRLITVSRLLAAHGSSLEFLSQ